MDKAEFKSKIEELDKKIKELEKEKAEYLTGWQRSRADFLNYKKSEIERMEELLKYADVGLILRILPILDNFDIIEKKLPEDLKKDENPEGKPSASYGASIKGFLLIKKQLQNLLENRGVEAIDCLGKKFDPNWQEIAEEVEVKDKEAGIIVEEIQKGYMMEGRLLRPARVKVTK